MTHMMQTTSFLPNVGARILVHARAYQVLHREVVPHNANDGDDHNMVSMSEAKREEPTNAKTTKDG